MASIYSDPVHENRLAVFCQKCWNWVSEEADAGAQVKRMYVKTENESLEIG